MNFLNFSKMASWTFDDWSAWTSGCVRSTEEVNPHEAVFRAQAADDVVGSLPRQLRLIAKLVAEPAEDLHLTLSYDTGVRQFGPLTVPLDARKMARRVRLEALGWAEDTAAALGPEVGQRLLADHLVIFEKAFPTPTSGSHKCFVCRTDHPSRGTNETTSQGGVPADGLAQDGSPKSAQSQENQRFANHQPESYHIESPQLGSRSFSIPRLDGPARNGSTLVYTSPTQGTAVPLWVVGGVCDPAGPLHRVESLLATPRLQSSCPSEAEVLIVPLSTVLSKDPRFLDSQPSRFVAVSDVGAPWNLASCIEAGEAVVHFGDVTWTSTHMAKAANSLEQVVVTLVARDGAEETW